MATIVVEALVSESVKLLLERIFSREFADFFRSTKLDYSLFEKLNITLLSLQAVLIDAEQKQITNEVVKKWLFMLQDVVFDAEDLFDEINTEALRCGVKAEHKGKRAKVRKFISSHFKTSYKTINSEMQKLLERLEHFANKGHLLGFRVGVSGSVWHGTPTSSVAEDESGIYGRDNDTKKLKNFLLSDDARDGGGKIGVISIVGMGGLGKTTLANLLYNDPKVEEIFNLKAWAHISKDFDVLKVTKALLESITGKSIEDNNLDTLQVQLQKSLKSKIFLLVLDDIWDVSYVDWNRLKDIFNVGEAGSRIVITTRNKSDALTMKTFLPIHDLEHLGSEDCWSLLAKHAFGASNYQQCSNLEEIGREIAQKCDGLPLAAVALGGLLRTKLSPNDWNDVLRSNIWELENATVKPALLLSYHYLPGHLKRCFAYCAIFPKNYKLEKEMVVQLWIAEGLVHQPKSEKSWEKEAEEYFDELVSRSLIQRRSVDGKEIFEMHDLMNELATAVSSPYCVRLDEQKEVESLERVRHLSYNRNGFDFYNKFDRLCGLKGLHTFLSLPLQEWGFGDLDNCMSDKAVGDLLLAMEHLHLLSLAHCSNITKVPTSIGNLIYLRYLNLSATNIVRLPSETWKLVNLQTLIVSNCWSLIELPEDVGKLVNLRNLDVSHTPLREMPVQIAKLKSLQTLSNFIVSQQQCDGLKVGELGKLPHLRGKLSISKLQNVTDPSDATQANLQTKNQIDELILIWHHPAPSDSNSLIQSVVLERLQPTVNMKSLAIEGYGGTNFPNWLGDSSYGNMVYLKISYCRICSRLPPLGQLGKLKELFVEGMKSIKSVGDEFYGNGSGPSFPSLETLSFGKMPEWEEWNLIRGTEFPILRHLTLQECPILRRLPPIGQLGKLKELFIKGMKSVKSVGVEFYGNGSVSSFQPFPSLETLSFEDMPEWEEWNLIGGTTTEFPALRRLILRRCPKLKGNIPTNHPSLIDLVLEGCPLLVEPWSSDDNSNMTQESLHNYTSLEYLRIYHSCYSMTSFTLGTFPVLKILTIHGCVKLKSIVIAEDTSQQQSLSFLKRIMIEDCDELESISFGGIGLGLSIPNLGYLLVWSCKKLRSLLEPMNTLVGLQSMLIYDLPNLPSIAKDGFPINLRRLVIGSIGGTLWNTIAWERLTCLSELEIKSADIVEGLMKMEMPLLPTSLVTLGISLGIECLDGKWLHHLTSLQTLHISHAPHLKSLPEEGFPSSLSKLRIYECPLLEAILQGKQGKEWSKIAHIPSIEINSELSNERVSCDLCHGYLVLLQRKRR